MLLRLKWSARQIFSSHNLDNPKVLGSKGKARSHKILPHNLLQDAEKQEANLLKQRQWLHDRLLLPKDRPLLRYSNAAKFDSSPDSHSGKLQDVHKGLKPSGIKGGQTHLIWGSYTYYHYLQASCMVVLFLAEVKVMNQPLFGAKTHKGASAMQVSEMCIISILQLSQGVIHFHNDFSYINGLAPRYLDCHQINV